MQILQRITFWGNIHLFLFFAQVFAFDLTLSNQLRFAISKECNVLQPIKYGPSNTAVVSIVTPKQQTGASLYPLFEYLPGFISYNQSW